MDILLQLHETCYPIMQGKGRTWVYFFEVYDTKALEYLANEPWISPTII